MPPPTGPAGGTSALTYSAACTKKLPPLRSVAPVLRSSTLDQPVGSRLGDTQRTPSEPCADAGTDHDGIAMDGDGDSPKLHRSGPA